MHPARLFVLCGLPGSGTTSRAIELEERFGAVRISTDGWLADLGHDIRDEAVRVRVQTIQRELTMSILSTGTDVVIEWRTWTRAERMQLRAVARATGSLVHLEFLDAPLADLWERVSRRGREHVAGPRAVTRSDLEEWSTVIERPTADELRDYDPMPPVRAGEQRGGPAFPYGSWRP